MPQRATTRSPSDLTWDMFRKKRNHARRAKVPFTLQYDRILLWPIVCPILGLPLVYRWRRAPGRHGPRKASPSFDRINPERGYVHGNVIVISHAANLLKSDHSLVSLRQIHALDKGTDIWRIADFYLTDKLQASGLLI